MHGLKWPIISVCLVEPAVKTHLEMARGLSARVVNACQREHAPVCGVDAVDSDRVVPTIAAGHSDQATAAEIIISACAEISRLTCANRANHAVCARSRLTGNRADQTETVL
eukprot:COSAG05_NODE_1165_length_5641_cov_433.265608_5_plen_111_part_00